MQPNPRRIAILTLVMAGIASAAVLIPIWTPAHRAAAFKFKTWIPVQMDVDAPQGWTSGRLLTRDVGGLADRCTSYGAGRGPNEEYSITIGADGFTSLIWKIDLVPSGDTMKVAIRSLSPHPPPPGSPPSSSLLPPVVRQMSLKEMQPIREALMNPDLWSTPEETEPFMCRYTGMQVTLEACVQGRYFARAPRHCPGSGSDEAVWKLQDLLHQRFLQTTVGR